MIMASGTHSMTRPVVGGRYAAVLCVFSKVFFLLDRLIRRQFAAAAAKFGVASPTPWEYLDGQGNPNNGGANFGVGGAAVTNAYGFRSLEQQVDAFEALVKGGTWTGAHLAQSGIGDFVDTVVDKMGATLQRLQWLGVVNIMVDNLVPMSCFTEAYKRCCPGSCDGGDVCSDPSKHVIFDSIHPTDAAWNAVTNLYTYSRGYTKGPTLTSWIKENNL